MRSMMSGWKSLAIGSAAMAVFSVGLCIAADEMPQGAPRGTPEDWKKRTGALVTAVETIDKGDKTAGQAALKTAMDCRGCHMAYRKPPARRGA